MIRRPKKPHLLFTALLLATGCGEADEASAPVAPAAVAPAEPVVEAPPPLTPAQAAAQRLGVLVDPCLNGAGHSMRTVRQSYLHYVDRENGPVRQSAVGYGMFSHTAGSTAACRTAVDEALAMEPAVPDLDGPTRAFITALEAADPVVSDAYTYYQRQTFNDDDGVHGRELHGELLRVLDAFATADDALRRVSDEYEQRSLDARVAELATQPDQRGPYLVERAHACTTRISRRVSHLEVAPLEDDDESFHVTGADGAALFASIEECQAHVDEMAGAPEVAAMSSSRGFGTEATTFLAAARIAARAVRDDTRYGYPAAAVDLINDSVDAFNTMLRAYQVRI